MGQPGQARLRPVSQPVLLRIARAVRRAPCGLHRLGSRVLRVRGTVVQEATLCASVNRSLASPWRIPSIWASTWCSFRFWESSTGGSTYVDTAGTTYVAEPANLAVVDRDGSALSQALEAYLADMHNVADVADDEFALQDALATNTVDAVVIVPEGFGSDCLAAARAGEELPKVEVAYGGYTQASALAEQQAVQWVQLAGAAAALEPEAGVSRIAELAAAATAERADTEVIGVSSSRGPSYPLGAYLSFSTYTIVCSIVVCVGLVLTKMSEQDVRRRMLVSPTRPWRLSAGVLVACLALVLCVWALTSAVGVISSGALANGVDGAQIALALGAMLAFSLVPLAFAFVLSQLGFREEGLNALGNLGGMVSSFLGGAWVPIALLGDRRSDSRALFARVLDKRCRRRCVDLSLDYRRASLAHGNRCGRYLAFCRRFHGSGACFGARPSEGVAGKSACREHARWGNWVYRSDRRRGAPRAVASDSLGKCRLPGAGDAWQTSRGASSRRVFNSWALPALTAGTGERGGGKSASQRACALPAAARLRAHRREVPKSCNPVHPRWQSQRFLSGGAGRACGTGRAGCRRSKGIPIRLRGCGPLPPARDTAW